MKHSDWTDTLAALWRGRRETLRPVRRIDPVTLADLYGIERQKTALTRNVERFLAGKPHNNVLLWGSRGTGKSSLIKAVLNHYGKQDLRLIEVDRDELADLPEILDQVGDLGYRFLLFCDDLSFESGEHGYRALKSALEGSIEAPPENIMVCATSNRRHLLPESMRDNLDTTIEDGELHYSDAVEEKLSLSERFGLRLAFHPFGQQQYLDVVRQLSGQPLVPGGTDYLDALRFARGQASFSGRAARQFVHGYY